MAQPKSAFPKDFFWGASTASHQVEGGTLNQWSVWELANAKELADTAHERLSWLPNWGEIKVQAEDPNNYVSGAGVDHYRRYKEDFDLAKQLHLNAFRFTIEWSRMEPEEGVWDQAAVEHYKTYIKELRARGLEPFLNIWHWTLPVWFTDKGGFAKKSNLVYFDRLVTLIAEELSDDLSYVLTLNEPNVYASFGYATGEWVPQEKNYLKFLWTYHNLAIAHRRAYKILKTRKPALQVGIAQAMSNSQPKRPGNLLDTFIAHQSSYWWNLWFLNRIRRQQDFIGFNYYFTDYNRGFKKDNPKTPVNDMGWYMEPKGIYHLLHLLWNRYKKPLFITENGLADAEDKHRQWWLQETIAAMDQAIAEGVDLRGYMHWSLLDNFEWKYGWWPKFGLIAVDKEQGMKRSIRPSAKWLARHIEKIGSDS